MKRYKVTAGLLAVSLLAATITGCSDPGDKKVKADEKDTTVAEENYDKDTDKEATPDETPKVEEPKDIMVDEVDLGGSRVPVDEQEEGIVYVSERSLSVREKATNNSKRLGYVRKWDELKVIEAVSDYTPEQASSTEENGEETEEIATEEQPKTWYKIEHGEGEGYVKMEHTLATKEAMLHNVYPELDFSAQEKVYEYANNPRVEVKGIFLTRTSAQSSKKVDQLIELANRTEINTFVIDVKDDDGKTLFPSEAAEASNPNANSHAQSMDYVKEMIQKLKDNDIYAIARVVSFKDPSYARTHPEKIITYKDGRPFVNSKVQWVPAYDRDLWKYNVEISKEAAELGFNEIQFDYVRFPASNGGKLDASLDYKNALNESKPQAIQNFLKYAQKELRPHEVYIAADIFGYVGSVEKDMGIGQHWEAVSNVVDYVAPMMYPSHYGPNQFGIPVPDANPYKTIYETMEDSMERQKNIEKPATMRPWIQDFTATWVKGYIKYGEKEVRDQIEALKEFGVNEYMLWNAGNRYTEAALAEKTTNSKQVTAPAEPKAPAKKETTPKQTTKPEKKETAPKKTEAPVKQETTSEQTKEPVQEEKASEPTESSVKEETAPEQSGEAVEEETAPEQSGEAVEEETAPEQSGEVVEEETTPEQSEEAVEEDTTPEQTEEPAEEATAPEESEASIEEETTSEQVEKQTEETKEDQ